MLKQAFCALMIVLVLLIGFQQALIVVHFKLNQETIERAYCMNKNKPELECHGTCHLKKQLQHSSNDDSASTRTYHRIDLFLISVPAFEANHLNKEVTDYKPIYCVTHYTEPYKKVLVPPPIG